MKLARKKSYDMEYSENVMNSEIERRSKISDGLVDGRYEGKKEIAINMIKENIPMETISKVTNLTIDEIQKMVDNQDE